MRIAAASGAIPHKAIAGPSPPTRCSRWVAASSPTVAPATPHMSKNPLDVPRASVGKSSALVAPTLRPEHAAATMEMMRPVVPGLYLLC